MKIIKQSEIVEVSRFKLCFNRDFGGGFAFDCNEDGTLHPFRNPDAERNYHRAVKMADAGELSGPFVEDWSYHYRQPAIGICDCGEEVWLEGFTCPCGCGRDYNSAGQLLAPREQWGVETGEHWTDVARIR